MAKKKIAVVVGPTACGKTDTAVELAKILDGEIISADSMQIYKEMDVGTAKPTPEEMQGIPHHLLDCVAPDESYSVARFKEEALAVIEEIHSRKKTPILAGGTGLYINALTLPWSFREKDTDPAIRARLEEEYRLQGAEVLYQRLKTIDPVSAEKIHPNNGKRVVRALEIFEVTGKTKAQQDEEARQEELPYDYCLMGITMERELLYERINRRIDLMVEAGLIDEVSTLLKKGYTKDLLSMKAIGYKEIFPYLEGSQSLDEALYILKRDTRHFAKRQLTWFRKDARIKWFDAQAYGEKSQMAEAMAEHYKSSI